MLLINTITDKYDDDDDDDDDGCSTAIASVVLYTREPSCSSMLPSVSANNQLRRGSRPSQGASVPSECGNRISGANFYVVFHSNYVSILLSF